MLPHASAPCKQKICRRRTLTLTDARHRRVKLRSAFAEGFHRRPGPDPAVEPRQPTGPGGQAANGTAFNAENAEPAEKGGDRGRGKRQTARQFTARRDHRERQELGNGNGKRQHQGVPPWHGYGSRSSHGRLALPGCRGRRPVLPALSLSKGPAVHRSPAGQDPPCHTQSRRRNGLCN